MRSLTLFLLMSPMAIAAELPVASDGGTAPASDGTGTETTTGTVTETLSEEVAEEGAPVSEESVEVDADASLSESDTSEGDEPLVAFDAPNVVNPFDEVKPFDSAFEAPLVEKSKDAVESDDDEVLRIAEEYLETSASLSPPNPKEGVVEITNASRREATNEVTALQSALNSHGFKVKIDGAKGQRTLQALKDFQAKKGLSATGELDDATRAALGLAR